MARSTAAGRSPSMKPARAKNAAHVAEAVAVVDTAEVAEAEAEVASEAAVVVAAAAATVGVDEIDIDLIR